MYFFTRYFSYTKRQPSTRLAKLVFLGENQEAILLFPPILIYL